MMTSQLEKTYTQVGDDIVVEYENDGYAALRRGPRSWTETFTPEDPRYEEMKRRMESKTNG